MAFDSGGGGSFHTGSQTPGVAWNRDTYNPEPGGPAEQAEYAAQTQREVEEDKRGRRGWIGRLLDAIRRRR